MSRHKHDPKPPEAEHQTPPVEEREGEAPKVDTSTWEADDAAPPPATTTPAPQRPPG